MRKFKDYLAVAHQVNARVLYCFSGTPIEELKECMREIGMVNIDSLDRCWGSIFRVGIDNDIHPVVDNDIFDVFIDQGYTQRSIVCMAGEIYMKPVKELPWWSNVDLYDMAKEYLSAAKACKDAELLTASCEMIRVSLNYWLNLLCRQESPSMQYNPDIEKTYVCYLANTNNRLLPLEEFLASCCYANPKDCTGIYDSMLSELMGLCADIEYSMILQ